MTPRVALAAAVLLLGSSPSPAALRYIAFGDSITVGVGDSTGVGYPKRLEKILEAALDDNVQVFKSAISGEETSEALSRINSALGGGGDGLLLMEGTNDVTRISEGGLSIETVLRNLDNLALTAQSRGVEPIHATVIPRPQNAFRDSDNIITEALIREIRELAYVRKRKLVDVFEALDPQSLEDVFKTYYVGAADRVGHPNQEGYQLIAETFADVLLEVDTTPPVVGTFFPGPLPVEVPPDFEFRVPIYEPTSASGIDQKRSSLLINGREVGETEGNRRKLDLVFQDPDTVGCRVVLGVRSQDRAELPNVMERVLGVYALTGRKVLPGDVDFDCRVDGFDLITFARGFGAELGEPRYQRRLDLNIDGVIDGYDLALLAKNFSRSSR